MKLSLLTSLLASIGGLGLAIGTLLWPTISQAQGFCYMVDSDGRVINLDDLCESGGASQSLPPQGPTSEAGAAPPQSGEVPQVRSFTVIGAPANTDPSEATPTTPSNSVDAESVEGEVVDSEPASVEPVGRQSRPGIPVDEIITPQIEVPQPQTPAVNGPNSSTSGGNGTAVRNGDRVIVVPPRVEVGD